MNEHLTLIWRLRIRLFHWGLVFLFSFLVFSGNIGGNWIEWHIKAAYCLSGLLIYRFMLGFVGSSTERFSTFVYSPKVAAQYLKRLLTGQSKGYQSHNPAGGIMVVLLLLLLLIQFLAGSVISDDIVWYGPLYEYVPSEISRFGTQLHYWMQWILLLLAAIHIIFVSIHQYWRGEPLIGSMIHGYKPKNFEMPNSTNVNFHPLGAWAALIVSLIWVGWLFSLPI